jgi:AbrB family looped-hinge helix DNA binding protein
VRKRVKTKNLIFSYLSGRDDGRHGPTIVAKNAPEVRLLLSHASKEGLLHEAECVVEYEYMKIQAKRKIAPIAVKLGVSRQIAIPKKIHDQLRLAPGDYLEVELEGDRVVLTPKALVQKRLAESLQDIEEGRVHGPFRSASALVRSLRKASKHGS